MKTITKKEFIQNIVNNETKFLGSVPTKNITLEKLESIIDGYDSSDIDIRTAKKYSKHIEFNNLSRLDIQSGSSYYDYNDNYIMIEPEGFTVVYELV